MASNRLVAPSRNGKALANASPNTPDELLGQFKRIEQAWKKAEDLLAATHVPVDVRILVDEGSDDDWQHGPIGEWKRFLGYCKVKGSRRVCLINYCLQYQFSSPNPDDGESEEITPITECPVDQRMEMFDHFQKLFDDAKAVAGSYVPKIRERVDSFLKELDSIK